MKYQFGEKIREMRERRGRTMKEVAEAVGISESMVSQIERNKVAPALETLLDLAAELAIEPEYLFGGVGAARKVKLVKAGTGGRATQGGVIFEKMARAEAAADGPGIAAYRLTVPPGAAKGSLEQGHPGRELGIILSGSGELEIGRECHPLTSGDSIAFPAELPHLLRNTGAEPLTAAWIVTPPRGILEDF